MTNPNIGGPAPDRPPATERSFDPAGEREPGVPSDLDDAPKPAGGATSGRGRHGAKTAGEAAERSVDVGGSPGAVPDDLRREPGRGETKRG